MNDSRPDLQVLLLVDLDYSWVFLEGAAMAGLTVHVIGIDAFQCSVTGYRLTSAVWVPEKQFHAPDLLPLVCTLKATASSQQCRLILVTLRERSVKMAAELAERAGCIGLSMAAATLFRDKWPMTQAARALGVRVPDTRLPPNCWANETFPASGVMLKPRRGSVSIGLQFCADRHALEASLRDLKDPSIYLAQEFIDGPMYFVDAIIREGHVHSILFGKHLVPLGSVGRGARSFLQSWAAASQSTRSARIDTALAAALASAHCAIARGFGCDNGCTHMEFFMAGDELVFCEAAARAGGTRILALQRCLWDVTMPALFAITLGRDGAARLPDPRDAVIGMIDFVAEGPVRECRFTRSLDMPWIVSVIDWDPMATAGGHYTSPLKRILITASCPDECEARLAWLSEGFEYTLA